MSDVQGKERRRLKRVVQRIPARFRAGSVAGQGHIKNISKEGLFIRTGDLPEAGQTIQVSFEALDQKVDIEGTVCWTTDQFPEAKDAPPGFGLRVDSPSRDFLHFFENLLLG